MPPNYRKKNLCTLIVAKLPNEYCSKAERTLRTILAGERASIKFLSGDYFLRREKRFSIFSLTNGCGSEAIFWLWKELKQNSCRRYFGSLRFQIGALLSASAYKVSPSPHHNAATTLQSQLPPPYLHPAATGSTSISPPAFRTQPLH